MKQVMMFGPQSFDRALRYATTPHYADWYGKPRTHYNVLLQAPDRRFGVTMRGVAVRLVQQGWRII